MDNVLLHSSEDVDLREFFLRQILNDDVNDSEKGLHDNILDFFKELLKNIFEEDSQKPDLIIFMARKAWCLSRLYLPLLYKKMNLSEEKIHEIESRLTHDGMMATWFNLEENVGIKRRKEINVFVVDDVCSRGSAIDKCVRRLYHYYGIEPHNIKFYVYAIKECSKNREKISASEEMYHVNKNQDDVRFYDFDIKWCGDRALWKDENDIRSISSKFVEAFHCCGIPYVSYVPGFGMDLSNEKVFETFGVNKSSETFITQDNLINSNLKDNKKFVFHNITIPRMHKWHIKSFVLYPLEDNICKLVPTDAEDAPVSLCALRFYIDTKTNKLLFIPIVSIKAWKILENKKIIWNFPKEMQKILEMESIYAWDKDEGELLTYRLLCYAVSYWWGKKVLHNLGLEYKKDYDLVIGSGIQSKIFLDWINDDSRIDADLQSIWKFFDAETIDLQPVYENDFDEKVYTEVFETVNKYPKAVPVDCYALTSQVFNQVYETEIKEDRVTRGIPMKKLTDFIHKDCIGLSKNDPMSKFKIASGIIQTVDSGVATMYAYHRGNTVGAYKTAGEQACHAIYNVLPSYANFLQNLINMIKDGALLPHKETLRQEIKSALEELAKKSYLSLSADALLRYFDSVYELKGRKDLKVGDLPIYCAMPYADVFDILTNFFNKILKRINQVGNT